MEALPLNSGWSYTSVFPENGTIRSTTLLLTFSKNDLYQNETQTVQMVKEAINTYGGVGNAGKESEFKTFPKEENTQLHIFKRNKKV